MFIYCINLIFFIIVLILNGECVNLKRDYIGQTSHPSWSEHPWDLHPFLEEQYYETVKFLNRNFKLQHAKNKRSLNREEIDLRVESTYDGHLFESNKASLFNVNGKRYILIEDNIYRVHEHENGAVFVEPEYILDIVDTVDFVTTAEFNMSTIVLMVYRSYSQVYILPNSAEGDWARSKLNQTFSSESNKPISAKFLQYKDLLYLVILYKNKWIGKVNSMIYMWTGTHFDELYLFETVNPSDLGIIDRKSHFLFVVLQNSQNLNAGSQIYKFIPEHGVFKIHPIRVRGQGKVHIYQDVDTEDTFAFLLNKNTKSALYKLINDDEFIFMNVEYDFKDVSASNVFNIEGKNIIFLAVDNIVSAYIAEDKELKLISEIRLPKKTSIKSMEYMMLKNSRHVLLILTKYMRRFSVLIVNFSISRNYIVSQSEHDDRFECLSDIEIILDKRQGVVDEIALKLDKILTRNGAIKNGILEVNSDVKLVNSRVNSIKITSDEELLQDTKKLIETAETVNDAIAKLENDVSYVIPKEGPINIHGTLVIDDDLKVDNLSTDRLNVESINEKPFIVEAFLFNNDTQHLSGDLFSGKTINTKRMKSPLINTFLERASTFQSLEAQSIILTKSNTINNINLNDIVKKGYSGMIMGKKTFEDLTVGEIETERLEKELLTPWIQRSINNEIPVKNLTIEKDLTVSNIVVKKINGINVTDLFDSIYQKGIHSNIEGNLEFESNLQVTHLKSDEIENEKVESFLTKSTEQTVSSTIKLKRLLAKSINVDTINELDIEKDVAITGKNTEIKSSVTMFDLNVARDLRLNCGSENQSFCNIIPTKPEDLLQIYHAPVTIVGTLTVPDLRFSKHARMKIDGIPFHTEIESLFWMTDKSQVIATNVTFTKGVSVPQISARIVNNRAVERIYSTVKDDRNVSLLLKNVRVNNDVIVPENTQCSTIREIERNAVRRSGTFNIKGKKTFKNTINVDSLRTDFINDLNMNDIILKNSKNIKFYGNMNIKTLRIQGDMIVNTNLKTDSINGYNLENIYKRAAKIDEETFLLNVDFKNRIEVDNLMIQNGILGDIAYIMKNTFDNIQVHVENDLYISNVYNVRVINDIQFDGFVEKVVFKDHDRKIYGNKHFKGDVAVQKDFYASTVNDTPFEKLFIDALTVSGDQEIKANHTIQNLITPYINTKIINEINTNQLIDTTSKDLYLDGDVRFEYLSVSGGVYGKLVSRCDLMEAVKSFGNLPAKKWNRVIVEGDVKWDYGDGNITRILKKTVLRDIDTVVDTEVTFEGSVIAESIWSDRYIDGVNLHYLAEDALRKYSDVTQTIHGGKTIRGDLIVENVVIRDVLESKIVNDLDVLKMNESIVRKSENSLIEGVKVLEADLEADSLSISGKVQDIFVDDLVYDGDTRLIKGARFKTLNTAMNLNVDFVNGINLNGFLKNVLRTNGPEQHIHQKVIFERLSVDECRLDSINEIPFEDMVVDSVYDRVDVYGDKIFMQDVDVRSRAYLDIVNEYHIQNVYKDTALSFEDVSIDGDVIFRAPVHFEGNIITENTVNDVRLRVSMDTSLKRIEGYLDENKRILTQIQNNLNYINDEIDKLSVEFLYADVLKEINIRLDQYQKSGIRTYKDETVIYIYTYISGEFCGLPNFCSCPKTYTLRVFQDGVSIVEIEAPLRIFPLLSPSDVTIELLTTTVTMSGECNKFNTNLNFDKSWILWNDKNKFDIGEHVKGFISDVKSFYSNGQYYMVVGQYYDIGYDSYNTDTVVLKLNIEQETATLVQRIPSYGAQTLSIAETEVAITLTIGNTFDSWTRTNNVELPIFHFNPAIMQFEFSQSIPSKGIKSIDFISNGKLENFITYCERGHDSLIILRKNMYNLQYIQYQTINFNVSIVSFEIAHVSNKNMREPLLCVTTIDERLHIYQHANAKKWYLHSSGSFPELKGVINFSLFTEQYIMALSGKSSKILWLVTQGLF